MGQRPPLPPMPRALNFRREQRRNGGYALLPAYSEAEMAAFASVAVDRLHAHSEKQERLLRDALEALEDLTDTGFTRGPQGKRARAAMDAIRKHLGDKT